MAHHLIFIENEVAQGRTKEEVFRQVDLEDHTAGCDALPVGSEDSPSGNPGLLFAWRSKGDDQIIYQKDKQTWVRNSSGYWVGTWNDKLPTENQLRRPYIQRGQWVTFANQSEPWKLPTPATIDQKISLDDTGEWKYKPIRELSWYGEEIDKRRSAFQYEEVDGELIINLTYDPLEMTKLIVRALRINYRITPEVCDMMDLFTQRSVSVAVGVMFGIKFEE